jgi:hypothetical protein
MRFTSPILMGLFILAVCQPASAQITYSTTLTSGPFFIAPEAANGSLDWVVVNDDSAAADIRVTIYKLDVSGTKVAIPPGLTVNLGPGKTIHNANTVSTLFPVGFYYELVVESTSDKVRPAVDQWSCFDATCFIPATLIPSGDFVITMTKKSK